MNREGNDAPLFGGVTMGRKSAMAFPSSSCSASTGAGLQPPALSAPSQGRRPAAAPTATGHRVAEGEHQLEKLEFALAVALTRGDVQRSEQLRRQIETLGGNREEPGT